MTIAAHASSTIAGHASSKIVALASLTIGVLRFGIARRMRSVDHATTTAVNLSLAARARRVHRGRAGGQVLENAVAAAVAAVALVRDVRRPEVAS